MCAGGMVEFDVEETFLSLFLEKMSKRFGRYKKYAYLCNRNRERWRDSSAG